MNWLETVCLNKYTRFFCFFFPSKNNDYNLQTFSLSLYQYTIYIILRSPISIVVQISQMAALKGSLRRRDGAVAHFLPRYWGFGHRHHFFRVRNLSSVRIHIWNLRFNMTAKVRVSYPFVFKFYSAPLLFIFFGLTASFVWWELYGRACISYEPYADPSFFFHRFLWQKAKVRYVMILYHINLQKLQCLIQDLSLILPFSLLFCNTAI